MTSQMSFSSVDEIRGAISSRSADSELENAIAHFLNFADERLSWQCLKLLLTHEDAKVRALGLRIVQRAVRETSLLENVVQLSFNVERLGELQHWYTAILSRYSLTSFAEKLCAEISNKADAEFSARSIRALEMHRMSDLHRKNQILERVRKCARDVGLDRG